MNKKILIILIVGILAILGFMLSRNKTVAPTDGGSVDVQSEIDKLNKDNKKSVTQPSSNQAATNQANEKKPMQLEIKTTKEGIGDRVVKSGDTIFVHYTGKLLDGTVFDSSIPRGTPFEFTIGQGMVIQGWEQGFIGAKVGEKRTLTIPSELGYGARGAGTSIPPNATLIFDVELVSIK